MARKPGGKLPSKHEPARMQRAWRSVTSVLVDSLSSLVRWREEMNGNVRVEETKRERPR